MKKLKIGYSSLSPSLSAAGDRRRLLFWASARGHSVTTDLSGRLDLIVASENSDFNSSIFYRKKIPIVFDLVDAYLSPTSPHEDFARGLAKKFSGQISGSIKPFSDHIKDFCRTSSAVICSSIEQEEIIRNYNFNTHVILDSHDEIPLLNPKKYEGTSDSECGLLWEGQPATIRGVRLISASIYELSKTMNFDMKFITDEEYFQFLNRFFKRSTMKMLEKDLANVKDRVRIFSWSKENLVAAAQQSSIAMIPIDLSVPMQRLKPENRLLIMWRLGLPCLTSPSPAYIRVSNKAGTSAICSSPDEWLSQFTRLMCDPELAFEEAVRGQNYLSEHHSREILLNKWDTAIKSVMV